MAEVGEARRKRRARERRRAMLWFFCCFSHLCSFVFLPILISVVVFPSLQFRFLCNFSFQIWTTRASKANSARRQQGARHPPKEKPDTGPVAGDPQRRAPGHTSLIFRVVGVIQTKWPRRPSCSGGGGRPKRRRRKPENLKARRASDRYVGRLRVLTCGPSAVAMLLLLY